MKKKKLLSLLVAAAMAVSAFPTAFADDAADDAAEPAITAEFSESAADAEETEIIPETADEAEEPADEAEEPTAEPAEEPTEEPAPEPTPESVEEYYTYGDVSLMATVGTPDPNSPDKNATDLYCGAYGKVYEVGDKQYRENLTKGNFPDTNTSSTSKNACGWSGINNNNGTVDSVEINTVDKYVTPNPQMPYPDKETTEYEETTGHCLELNGWSDNYPETIYQEVPVIPDSTVYISYYYHLRTTSKDTWGTQSMLLSVLPSSKTDGTKTTISTRDQFTKDNAPLTIERNSLASQLVGTTGSAAAIGNDGYTINASDNWSKITATYTVPSDVNKVYVAFHGVAPEGTNSTNKSGGSTTSPSAGGGNILAYASVKTELFQDVYVSSTGSDTTGSGKSDNPFATLDYAYHWVAEGGTIHVMDDITCTVSTNNPIKFEEDKSFKIQSADTASPATITWKGYENLFSVGTGAEVTLENIKIVRSDTADNKVKSLANVAGGTINIGSGVTLKDCENLFYFTDNSSVMTMGGCTLENVGALCSKKDGVNDPTINLTGVVNVTGTTALAPYTSNTGMSITLKSTNENAKLKIADGADVSLKNITLADTHMNFGAAGAEIATTVTLSGTSTVTSDGGTVKRASGFTGPAPMFSVADGTATFTNITIDGYGDDETLLSDDTYGARVPAILVSAGATATLGDGATVTNFHMDGREDDNTDKAIIVLNGTADADATLNIQGTASITGNNTRGKVTNAVIQSVGAEASGVVNMTGGSITGNLVKPNTGAVCVTDKLTFNVGGTAVIKENTTSGGPCNVYLANEQTVNISSETPLADVAAIGVTTATPPSDTADVKIATGASETDSNCFAYDTDSTVAGFIYCDGTSDSFEGAHHETHAENTVWLSTATTADAVATVTDANGITRYYTSISSALVAAGANDTADTITLMENPSSDISAVLNQGDTIKTADKTTYTAESDSALHIETNNKVTLVSGKVKSNVSVDVINTTVAGGATVAVTESGADVTIPAGSEESPATVTIGSVSVANSDVNNTLTVSVDSNGNITSNLDNTESVIINDKTYTAAEDGTTLVTDADGNTKVTAGSVTIGGDGQKITAPTNPETVVVKKGDDGTVTVGVDGSVEISDGAAIDIIGTTIEGDSTVVVTDSGADVTIPANGEVTIGSVAVANPDGSDALTVSVDKDGNITSNLDNAKSVKVNGETYTAAENNTTLVTDKDGNVTVTKGSVTIGGDGQKITAPTDPETVVVKKGDDGTVTVGVDGSVEISDGAAVDIIGTTIEGESTVVVTETGADVTIPANGEVTIGSVAVANPDGSDALTVSVDKDGNITSKLNVKKSVKIGGKAYTAEEDDTQLVTDKDGNVTLVSGAIALDPTDTVTANNTQVTGASEIAVDDSGITAVVPADGKVTFGDKTVNNAGSAEMKVKLGSDGNITLEDGAAALAKDESIDVSVGDTVIPVKNDGDATITVTAGENPSVTVPASGTAVIGNTEISAGDTEKVVKISDTGKLSVELKPGETVTVGGVEYTAGEDGAVIEIDPDTGAVSVTTGALELDEDLFKNADYEFTLSEGASVKIGDYIYTAGENSVVLKGNANGNPIVALESKDDTVNVRLAEGDDTGVDYTAAGANTQFAMSEGSAVTPATKADTSKITLIGSAAGTSGLAFEGKTSVTVDGVKYTGSEDTASYNVLFGNNDKNQLEMTSGKVTIAFSEATQAVDVKDSTVSGKETGIAGNLVPVTAGAATNVVITHTDGSSPSNDITAGTSTKLTAVKDEDGNVTGYTTARKSSGGSPSSSSSKVTATATPTVAPTAEPTAEPAATDEPSATDKPEATNEPAAPSDTTENPFTDVTNDYWYYATVLKAYEYGLMDGVTNTEFAPFADITRGMFVTVLYRMESEPETALDYAFEDVAADAYYADAVAWGSANGIILGYSATEYAPDDIITREQMAAIIYRYAKSQNSALITGNASGDTLAYSDSADISDYAKEAVVWAADNSIMIGNTDGTFTPQSSATRAEAAAVFVRIYELMK